MKLTVTFEGNEEGMKLEMDLAIPDISKDAIALGYIADIMGQAADRLRELCVTVPPEQRKLVLEGLLISKAEREASGNEIYPFTRQCKSEVPMPNNLFKQD